MKWPLFILIPIIFQALDLMVFAQTQVQDIFGRSLNTHGITLVDWDGYMANPLIKFYLLPPTNAVLPGSATLTANGARLYFGTPSSVSASGPGTTPVAHQFHHACSGQSIDLSGPQQSGWKLHAHHYFHWRE